MGFLENLFSHLGDSFMAEVTAQAGVVSSTVTRSARRIATRLLWILDRVRFRNRAYSANGLVAWRDDDGNVVIKVPRAELFSRLVPDKSKKLKSKRANIQLLASRLVQNEAVLSHLTQVM